jgi:hypothetical protein
MGLSAWGIDASPIAVAIAQAKLATAKLEEILALAKQFIAEKPKHIPQTEFFEAAYSSQTLIELCSLREGLLNIAEETCASILLRAAALGCLHGPLSKTMEGAGYFSNQMPRTFSPKPGYSLKYWKQHRSIAPNVKILDILSRKLSRIPDLDNESYSYPERILYADARSSRVYKQIHKNVSMVITSPPYYGMRTYIQDQWLRMWFLGGPETISYQNKSQLDHNGQDSFIRELATVWKNIYQSQSDCLDLYVRFGTVPSVNSNARHILKSSLEASGGWKLISVRNAKNAHAGKRQADQMATGSKAAEEYDFHAVRA